jgi:hypothetical protein
MKQKLGNKIKEYEVVLEKPFIYLLMEKRAKSSTG